MRRTHQGAGRSFPDDRLSAGRSSDRQAARRAKPCRRLPPALFFRGLVVPVPPFVALAEEAWIEGPVVDGVVHRAGSLATSRLLHGDDHLAARATRFEVRASLRGVAERIAPVDHGCHLACCISSARSCRSSCVRLAMHHAHLLIDERLRASRLDRRAERPDPFARRPPTMTSLPFGLSTCRRSESERFATLSRIDVVALVALRRNPAACSRSRGRRRASAPAPRCACCTRR